MLKNKKLKALVISMGIAYAAVITLWTWKLIELCYNEAASLDDDMLRRCIYGSTEGTKILAFVTIAMTIVFIIMTVKKKEVR